MHAVWASLANQIALFVLQLLIISVLVVIQHMKPSITRWLKHHTSLQERTLLKELANEAYHLAEQTVTGQGGAKKLEVASQYLADTSGKMGLSLTSNEIRAAIEVAVHDANSAQQKTPAS